MSFATADLCDQYSDSLQVLSPGFHDYGGRRKFFGAISTIKAHEDNSLVRTALAEDGNGRVLVVDGGASLRCAMLGDQLAQIAVENAWSGVIISGCIRDAAVIEGLDLGVKALDTHPKKSIKQGIGERDIEVIFSGVIFRAGAYVYADEDGVVVSEGALF